MQDKISTADARSQFADVINQVAYGGARIVLTKYDKEIAAVIPMADFEKLGLLEQTVDLAQAMKALKEIDEAGGLVSLNDLLAKLDLE